jgi:hypothetical protein
MQPKTPIIIISPNLPASTKSVTPLQDHLVSGLKMHQDVGERVGYKKYAGEDLEFIGKN